MRIKRISVARKMSARTQNISLLMRRCFLLTGYGIRIADFFSFTLSIKVLTNKAGKKSHKGTERLLRGIPLANDQVALRDSVNDIGAADDTYQFAILYNRDTLDLAFGEEHGNLADGRLLVNDQQLVAHNIANTQSIAVDFADNVGLGNNTDQLAISINYGRATDTVAVKQLRRFLRAGLRLDGTYLAGHNVSCNHRARSFGCW